MASVVIVTSQCYLLAEAINYIVINECEDNNDHDYVSFTRSKTSKAKHKTDKAKRNYIQERKPFEVIINFIPKGHPPTTSSPHLQKHGNNDVSTVQVRIHGLRRTLRVFQDIVSQLREQIPDEKFLDTLIDRFMATYEDEEKALEKMEL